MRYYKVPIVNGEFTNINYDTIEEGFAFDKHVKNGYGYINNKTISKKDTPFFREIPCNKDIYYANTLTNLNKNLYSAYKETNIFGAIILKWVNVIPNLSSMLVMSLKLMERILCAFMKCLWGH